MLLQLFCIFKFGETYFVGWTAGKEHTTALRIIYDKASLVCMGVHGHQYIDVPPDNLDRAALIEYDDLVAATNILFGAPVLNNDFAVGVPQELLDISLRQRPVDETAPLELNDTFAMQLLSSAWHALSSEDLDVCSSALHEKFIRRSATPKNSPRRAATCRGLARCDEGRIWPWREHTSRIPNKCAVVAVHVPAAVAWRARFSNRWTRNKQRSEIHKYVRAGIYWRSGGD